MASRKEKLNKRYIQNLKPESKRYHVLDSEQPGLSIEVMTTGEKIWRYKRTLSGYEHRATLGNFKELHPDHARDLAARISIKHRSGEPLNNITLTPPKLDDIFDQYVVEFEKRIAIGERRPKSLEDIKTRYRLSIGPHLGKAEIAKIGRADVVALLDTLPSYALYNKTLTVIKSLLNYALERDIITKNVCQSLKKTSEVVRERILSKEEFERLLLALEENEPEIYVDLFWLLILTGQRKSCVYSMEWREIDFENNLWIIPTAKLKSKKAHAVPLTDHVIEILNRRKKEIGNTSIYVFPSMTSRDKHVYEKGGKGSWWRRSLERADLWSDDKQKRLVIHDLRRTLASWAVMNTGDIASTSKLLAHGNINITSKVYAHLDTQSVRDVLDRATIGIKRKRPEQISKDELTAELAAGTTPERATEIIKLLNA